MVIDIDLNNELKNWSEYLDRLLLFFKTRFPF